MTPLNDFDYRKRVNTSAIMLHEVLSRKELPVKDAIVLQEVVNQLVHTPDLFDTEYEGEKLEVYHLYLLGNETRYGFRLISPTGNILVTEVIDHKEGKVPNEIAAMNLLGQTMLTNALLPYRSDVVKKMIIYIERHEALKYLEEQGNELFSMFPVHLMQGVEVQENKLKHFKSMHETFDMEKK